MLSYASLLIRSFFSNIYIYIYLFFFYFFFWIAEMIGRFLGVCLEINICHNRNIFNPIVHFSSFPYRTVLHVPTAGPRRCRSALYWWWWRSRRGRWSALWADWRISTWPARRSWACDRSWTWYRRWICTESTHTYQQVSFTLCTLCCQSLT